MQDWGLRQLTDHPLMMVGESGLSWLEPSALISLASPLAYQWLPQI